MTTPLVKRLQIKPDRRGRVLNRPRGLDLPGIGPAQLTRQRSDLDWLLAFVRNRRDVEDLAARLDALVGEDSVIWLAYPKQSSGVRTDINRDRGWRSIRAKGLRPVRQIAIDDTWSALRFRF